MLDLRFLSGMSQKNRLVALRRRNAIAAGECVPAQSPVHAVVIATGAQYRKLTVDSYSRFEGSGNSVCRNRNGVDPLQELAGSSGVGDCVA
jgi:hypothetical protein